MRGSSTGSEQQAADEAYRRWFGLIFRAVLLPGRRGTALFVTVLFFAAVEESSYCGCVVAAMQTEPDESEIIRNVPVDRMKVLVDRAMEQKQIITDLTMRVSGREIVFDVRLSQYANEEPWIVLLNLSQSAYLSACQKYEADGYRRLVDRGLVVERQRLHAVVWVKDISLVERSRLRLPEGPVPEDGTGDSRLEPLYAQMRTFLKEHNIPGATLALAKDGRLISRCGFGYSQLQPPVAMRANTRLRIASVSKPITAVSVLRLAEQGKLDLDARVLDVLKSMRYINEQPPADSRWYRITVRHLLQHRGGWDRDESTDPMFRSAELTQALNLRRSAGSEDIIRYQLQERLDFDPGSRFAYSNFGYCLLGRVIEAVSGQSYAAFVEQEILRPAGMERTRLGRTRMRSRMSDEAFYYTQTLSQYPAFWEAARSSRTKRIPDVVSAPYGRWDLEVMDAHSGWTSTAGELLRFVTALYDSRQPLLRPETRAVMLAPPENAPAPWFNSWYGCGWSVCRAGGPNALNCWHDGGLDGTSSLLVHRADGFAWAILFNVDMTSGEVRCGDAINKLLHETVSGLTETPDHDLFRPSRTVPSDSGRADAGVSEPTN